MSIEFRLAGPADAPGLSGFIKAFWGADISPAYWSWKYFANPFGPSGISIAIDNNEIVGRAGSYALPFVIDGTEMTVHYLCDTDIFDKHRSNTTMLGLVNALAGAPGPHGFEGVEYAICTPTAAEYAQAFFGFTGLGASDSFIKIVNPLPFIKKKLKIPFPAFANRAVKGVWTTLAGRKDPGGFLQLKSADIRNALAVVESSKPEVGILRDPRYLEWRYMQYPQASYSVLFDDRSPGKGLVFSDIVPAAGVRYGIIHDIICRETGSEVWRRLLSASIAGLIRNGADAIILRGIFPQSVTDCLKAHHFFRRNSNCTLVVRTSSGGAIAEALGDRKKWFLSMGDLGTPL